MIYASACVPNSPHVKNIPWKDGWMSVHALAAERVYILILGKMDRKPVGGGYFCLQRMRIFSVAFAVVFRPTNI